MSTVKDILDALERFAPFETAEEWDNSGLIVGDENQTVTCVLTALDVTPSAIEQAVRCGAQLIVSHHPVIFDPLSQLTATHLAYQLANQNIAAIAVHTNGDKAIGGVNDRLASLLGLTDTNVAEDGMTRIGRLPEPMTAQAFADYTANVLHTTVRIKKGTDLVRTVAVCGGAAADLVIPLLSKADAAVTGEVKHHEWLQVPPVKTLIDGGHYATEIAMATALAEYLAVQFPTIQITVADQTAPYETVG